MAHATAIADKLTGPPLTTGYRPTLPGQLWWSSDGTAPNYRQFLADVLAYRGRCRLGAAPRRVAAALAETSPFACGP